MSYEITYRFHSRLEEGTGYKEEIEEKSVKIGKPFDDISLEQCAAAIMSQLARRDIWVVEVEVHEFVKKKISFKESKDGSGIILKNKKFSLNQTAQLLTSEIISSEEVNSEKIKSNESITSVMKNLYVNPSQSSVRHIIDKRSINKSKILYYVYYEPYIWENEAKVLKLKFTEGKKYPVHQVIPSVTGKLDAQQIAITDDTGNVLILDEKFFTSAGKGLMGDEQPSDSNLHNVKQHKLIYEDELPDDLMTIPDLRKK
jgi:hypothetical protein